MKAMLSFSLLFLVTLNDVIANVCPAKKEIPWSSMCYIWTRCYSPYPVEVYVARCRGTTLPTGPFPAGNRNLSYRFYDSNLRVVSSHAFSRITAARISLKNTFTTFQTFAFSGLRVNCIDVNNNKNLTTLPSGVFHGVSGLRKLYLYENNLQWLPSNVFHGLERLEVLDLTANSLSCFHHQLFKPLPFLQELAIQQLVQVSGICRQSFQFMHPLRYIDLEFDTCVMMCSEGGDLACDCSSMEGCLDCTATHAPHRVTSRTISTTTAASEFSSRDTVLHYVGIIVVGSLLAVSAVIIVLIVKCCPEKPNEDPLNDESTCELVNEA